MITIKHGAARSTAGVASIHLQARRVLSAAMGILFLGLTACDSLLEVENPGIDFGRVLGEAAVAAALDRPIGDVDLLTDDERPTAPAPLLIDRIEWRDGWPFVGTPSEDRRRAPVT